MKAKATQSVPTAERRPPKMVGREAAPYDPEEPVAIPPKSAPVPPALEVEGGTSVPLLYLVPDPAPGA